MVEAMLFIARTGCQWRYLPERYGAWTAVWAQWRRWRANGVWARAMLRLAALVRVLHGQEPLPSMVMVDAQSVKGGAKARPSTTPAAPAPGLRHQAQPAGRDPGAAHRRPRRLGPAARRHRRPRAAARAHLPELPRLRAVVGDRAYRGLTRIARHKRMALDIKAPPSGRRGFTPIRPLVKIEHAFAQLGRWRRLSRCCEGSAASARAWLEVASVGYLA
jgi:transposase